MSPKVGSLRRLTTLTTLRDTKKKREKMKIISKWGHYYWSHRNKKDYKKIL